MTEIQNLKENLDLIKIGEKEIYLVGTAHISKSSVELAEETVLEQKPDTVAVELCEPRYESLKDPDRWKNTNIVSIIREGKAYVLMAQLMLAGFQKKLGDKLEVTPGAEMMISLKAAAEVGAEPYMADRCVRTTLKRTWGAVSFFSMIRLTFSMILGMFAPTDELEEDDIERLKSSDALEELLNDFSNILPDVRRTLIDERDIYLSQKIKNAPGNKIVAIVGAGHVPGIKKHISEDIDLKPLEEIPPPRKAGKIIGWAIPCIFVVLVTLGFVNAGAETGFDMLGTWFWINAITGALGATIAMAHPLTILAAFLASPFTSLNPMIAGGWVAGLVEALIREPRVSDLQSVADDITTVKGIWTNRVSKILLIICLTNLMGSIGTFIGLERLISIL